MRYLFIWFVVLFDKTLSSEVVTHEERGCVSVSICTYWQRTQEEQRPCWGKEVDVLKGQKGGWVTGMGGKEDEGVTSGGGQQGPDTGGPWGLGSHCTATTV